MSGPWEDYGPAKSGPWEDYKDQSPAEPKTGAGEAALEHFGNAATLGYLPQIQAGVEKLTPDPGADTDADLKSQGFKISQPENSYLSDRDENLKRMALEGKEHPVASAAGTVGGIVGGGLLASAALPVGEAATLGNGLVGPVTRGADLANKVVQGIKGGAIAGGLANPGDTEGEIDPIQAEGRAKGAALGAAIGGAVPLAQQAISSGATSVGDYLRNKAALKATRSLGRPTPTQATRMAATGQDVTLGRDLLDQGAIPVLGTPGRIAGRVDALKEQAGENIGNLIKSGGDSKMIDSQKLGIQILDSPELAQMRKTPGMESTVSAIEKQVNTLAQNGEMTLGEAQTLRQGIDKSINFNKASPDMRGAQEGLYQQRTAIRDAMNDAVNGLPSSPGQDALKVANRRYGNLSTAQDILEKQMGRDQANRAVSLTDTIAGAGGMAKHGLPGLALGAANKFGRTFGNSIQANVYNKISQGLPAVAKAADAVNPQVAQMIAQRAARGQPGLDEDTDSVLKNKQLMDIYRAEPARIDSIEDMATRNKIKRALNLPITKASP
jgi:hypothetical protein